MHVCDLPQIIEITLPEDIERMRAARQSDEQQVGQLEILDEAVCTSATVQVSSLTAF